MHPCWSQHLAMSSDKDDSQYHKKQKTCFSFLLHAMYIPFSSSGC